MESASHAELKLKITILSRLSIFQSEKHLYSKRAPLIIPISHRSQPFLPFLPSTKQNRKCNELSKNCSTIEKSVKNTNFLTKVIKWRATKKKNPQQSQLHWSKRFQKPFFASSSKRMHFFRRFAPPHRSPPPAQQFSLFSLSIRYQKLYPLTILISWVANFSCSGSVFFIFFGCSLLAFPFGLAKVFSFQTSERALWMCVYVSYQTLLQSVFSTPTNRTITFTCGTIHRVGWQGVLGPHSARCIQKRLKNTHTHTHTHTKKNGI